jgi:phytoene/squalene synthetase
MLDVDRSQSDPDLDPTEARVRFHAPHLERVSRSFAFGISRLEPELRANVGLGYLVCRILDTVEDAQWVSGEEQRRTFTEFEKFVTQTATDRGAIEAWAARFPTTIADGERLLLNDAPEIFREFAALDEKTREAMLPPVLSMSRGMIHFTERARRTGALRLKDLADVNTYCFFVAGVVGELLTGLIDDEKRPIGLDLAIRFGLFLQKINVLKDQWTDESEGRFLVPDRPRVLESLARDADGAFRYLQAIPLARKDYRLFCAWALYLGLATIPLLREANGETVKLGRVQALALGAKIELAIDDNARLRALFEELAPRARGDTEAAGADGLVDFDVLRDNYIGRLAIDRLASVLSPR